jgi:cytochrome P450 family 135
VMEYGERLARPHFLDLLLPLSWPSPQDFSRARFRKRWTAFVGMLMAERRAAGKNEGAPAHDLFDLMGDARDPETGEAFTDDQLGDQIATMILAGHETTATALAWALYELGRDEALLARTVAAVDGGDDAWLEAVLKESMRLHPVIPMVARTLTAPATIGGIDLPAGVTVGPSILLSHARPENFPVPGAFRPERFLEGSPAPNTWIPFGGGVRRCIGAGFSLMEGVVVLREVLAAYTLRTLAEDRPKVRNITSVPRGGARIRVTAR